MGLPLRTRGQLGAGLDHSVHQWQQQQQQRHFEVVELGGTMQMRRAEWVGWLLVGQAGQGTRPGMGERRRGHQHQLGDHQGLKQGKAAQLACTNPQPRYQD